MLKDKFINTYGYGKKVIDSQSWCLGGEDKSYDCVEKRSPEPQLLDFEEFDEILEDICPDITYLEHRKLFRITVETKTRPIATWNQIYEAYYQCDLSLLFDELKKMNVL